MEAARRSGLSPHVVRMWERRYGAVNPTRTATHRRVYSPVDVERLRLLRLALGGGYSIGQIARLSDERLLELAADATGEETDSGAGERASARPDAGDDHGANQPNASATVEAPTSAPHDGPPPLRVGEGVRERPVVGPEPSTPHERYAAEELQAQALAAVRALDSVALGGVLARASVTLSPGAVMEQFLQPLLQTIGEDWRTGDLRVMHEHFATALIRPFLTQLGRFSSAPAGAPVLTVTTPAGQFHEMGALFAAVTAASEGWRVDYLGPNLPAEEIAAAALARNARAVALSLIYPCDDLTLMNELRALRRLLPPSVALFVGGQCSPAFRDTLVELGAEPVNVLQEFRRRLERLRAS